MLLLTLIFCLMAFGSHAVADNDPDSGEAITSIARNIEKCTITGTISARGVRDARDVIVYLEKVEGNFKPDSIKPVLNQINRVFVPHVMPILVGTTVQFANSDSFDHNIFSPSKTKPFNIGTWGYGGVRDITFDDTGVVSLLCNVHREMSAFIVVLQNPFFSLTGPDGKYSIEDVPPGKYTLITWHGKLKEQSDVIEVKAGDSVTVDFRLSP